MRVLKIWRHWQGLRNAEGGRGRSRGEGPHITENDDKNIRSIPLKRRWGALTKRSGITLGRETEEKRERKTRSTDKRKRDTHIPRNRRPTRTTNSHQAVKSARDIPCSGFIINDNERHPPAGEKRKKEESMMWKKGKHGVDHR